MRFTAHGPKSYIKVIEHHLINAVAGIQGPPLLPADVKRMQA